MYSLGGRIRLFCDYKEGTGTSAELRQCKWPHLELHRQPLQHQGAMAEAWRQRVPQFGETDRAHWGLWKGGSATRREK